MVLIRNYTFIFFFFMIVCLRKKREKEFNYEDEWDLDLIIMRKLGNLGFERWSNLLYLVECFKELEDNINCFKIFK